MPDFNAVVVAGGRSSRLGGIPKAGLSNGEITLLGATLTAVGQASCRVVVGPEDLPLPTGVIQTLEEPRFGGPAAALSAGVRALPQDSALWTLLLSVDMPGVTPAVQTLLAQADAAAEMQGFMGITDGVLQPLAGIYRTEALVDIAGQDLTNKSVRRWLGQLRIGQVELPSGSTQDIDTWEQARALGFVNPSW